MPFYFEKYFAVVARELQAHPLYGPLALISNTINLMPSNAATSSTRLLISLLQLLHNASNNNNITA
jgi:hypothetical protein